MLLSFCCSSLELESWGTLRALISCQLRAFRAIFRVETLSSYDIGTLIDPGRECTLITVTLFKLICDVVLHLRYCGVDGRVDVHLVDCSNRALDPKMLRPLWLLRLLVDAFLNGPP